MARLYLSAVVGDGTPARLPGGNPYRPRIADLPHTAFQVIELPSLSNGAPKKMWAHVFVEAVDFSVIDADPNVVALSDLEVLDTLVTNAIRNRVNNVLGRLGVVTVAVTGETVRDLVNRLLEELGASARV